MDYVVKQIKNSNGEKTVIVKQISFFAKLLEICSDSIYKILRFIMWSTICILITIGINTLLNGQLREQAMHVIYQLIGG